MEKNTIIKGDVVVVRRTDPALNGKYAEVTEVFDGGAVEAVVAEINVGTLGEVSTKVTYLRLAPGQYEKDDKMSFQVRNLRKEQA